MNEQEFPVYSLRAGHRLRVDGHPRVVVVVTPLRPPHSRVTTRPLTYESSRVNPSLGTLVDTTMRSEELVRVTPSRPLRLGEEVTDATPEPSLHDAPLMSFDGGLVCAEDLDTSRPSDDPGLWTTTWREEHGLPATLWERLPERVGQVLVASQDGVFDGTRAGPPTTLGTASRPPRHRLVASRGGRRRGRRYPRTLLFGDVLDLPMYDHRDPSRTELRVVVTDAGYREDSRRRGQPLTPEYVSAYERRLISAVGERDPDEAERLRALAERGEFNPPPPAEARTSVPERGPDAYVATCRLDDLDEGEPGTSRGTRVDRFPSAKRVEVRGNLRDGDDVDLLATPVPPPRRQASGSALVPSQQTIVHRERITQAARTARHARGLKPGPKPRHRFEDAVD